MITTTPHENQRAKPDECERVKPVRNFTEDDRDITDFLEDRVATPRQVAIAVARNQKGIRRRLLELSEGETPWLERVKVGGQTYYSSGFPLNPRQALHDSLLTGIFLGLRDHVMLWVQHPAEFHERRRRIKGKYCEVPDAYTQLNAGYSYFVEVERQRGSSRLIEKCREYCKYESSGEFTRAWFGDGEKETFSVLIICRSRKKIESLRRRFRQIPGLNTRKFMFATEDDVIRDPTGAIWVTPGTQEVCAKKQCGKDRTEDRDLCECGGDRWTTKLNRITE